MDWSILSIEACVDAKAFLSVFHAVVLWDGQAVGFEPGNVVIFLYEFGDVSDLSVAIAVDQSEPFHLVVDPLRCEFSEAVDGLEIRGGDASVGIDVEEVDDGDEQALPEHHVAFGRVLLCWKGLPVNRANVFWAWDAELALRGVRIQSARWEIAALDCIGMDHFEEMVVEDAGAAIFWKVIVFVFGGHRFFWVNAVEVLKVGAVVLDHLAENLCLDLFQKFL